MNIITSKSVLESSDKLKENWKDEHTNTLCETFYVVYFCMLREILEYQKVGGYWTDRNQGHLFFVCLVGKEDD